MYFLLRTQRGSKIKVFSQEDVRQILIPVIALDKQKHLVQRSINNNARLQEAIKRHIKESQALFNEVSQTEVEWL